MGELMEAQGHYDQTINPELSPSREKLDKSKTPRMPADFKTMLHVSHDGNVTGDYWNHLREFENRKNLERRQRFNS